MQPLTRTDRGAVSHKVPSALAPFFQILVFLFITTTIARAEPAILELVLNDAPRGSYFVDIDARGDISLSAEDYSALGLPEPTLPPTTLDGKPYHVITRAPDIQAEFDETTLTLSLTVAAQLLPRTRINLGRKVQTDVYLPEEKSLFVNYGLSLFGDHNETLRRSDLSHEVGWRTGKGLFLTDGFYTNATDRSEYVRLSTSYIRDDRKAMERFTVGDLVAAGDPSGSKVQIGGIGFAKNFDLDPYVITFPGLHLEGVADSPSEVDILIDGYLVRQELIAPGPFEIENLSHYEGTGEVEIVLRDALGHETRVLHPFYLSDVLLQKGRHDYRYQAGALREDFGSESFKYGDFVFSGIHRYGVSDTLTSSLALEGHQDFVTVLPRVTWKKTRYGLFNLVLGGSVGDSSRSGYVAGGEHFYRSRMFNSSLSLYAFSPQFSRLDSLSNADMPTLQAKIRFGYTHPNIGSLSTNFVFESFEAEDDRQTTTVNYHRRLSNHISMYLSLRDERQQHNETVILVGLNFIPGRDLRTTARTELRDDSQQYSVSLQKDAPTGTGYGYHVDLEAIQQDTVDSITLSPGGEYRHRLATVRAKSNLSWIDNEFRPDYRLTLAGSISSIGGRTYFSRPIQDSFALVDVAGLENIRIMKNSEVIATTDTRGQALLPELTSFYQNQITLEDRDVPIEYSLPAIQKFISPPLRGGGCIFFPATRIQALTGKFRVRLGNELVPYEYRSVQVSSESGQWSTQTGHDGEFYIDPRDGVITHGLRLGCSPSAQKSADGHHKMLILVYDWQGKDYAQELAIPASKELFIDLGEVTLDVSSEHLYAP